MVQRLELFFSLVGLFTGAAIEYPDSISIPRPAMRPS
jgi:hypothetical protein